MINRNIAVFIFFIMVLSITGCVRKICVEGFNSGEVYSDGIEEFANRVKGVIKETVGINKENLIITGHQLGNYQDYPKYPGNISNKEFSVTGQMERSFACYNLTGVEADVQLGPDRKEVYIIHEKITDKFDNENDENWKKEKIFHDKNTLKILLQKFIDLKNDQYAGGCRIRGGERFLYIELKATKADSLDKNNEEAMVVKRSLDTISDVVSSYPEREEEIRKHIGFISFNYHLLNEVIKAGQGNKKIKMHKLYYIACSNKTLGKAAACFCPELNNPDDFFAPENKESDQKELWNLVNNSNELSGIWFSPADINNAIENFILLNKEREKKHLFQLEYFLSTYQKSGDVFFSILDEGKNLKDNKYFYKNIEGIIFDIKNR